MLCVLVCSMCGNPKTTSSLLLLYGVQGSNTGTAASSYPWDHITSLYLVLLWSLSRCQSIQAKESKERGGGGGGGPC